MGTKNQKLVFDPKQSLLMGLKKQAFTFGEISIRVRRYKYSMSYENKTVVT